MLYKEHASKAGIDIEVVREPADGYWSNVWMVKPWSMSYWGGRPTEDWMFSIGYAAGGSWNESFWSNDRFMELLVAARAELNQDKRREPCTGRCSCWCATTGGSVIPMYANYIDGVSDKVAHPEAHGVELGARRLEADRTLVVRLKPSGLCRVPMQSK